MGGRLSLEGGTYSDQSVNGFAVVRRQRLFEAQCLLFLLLLLLLLLLSLLLSSYSLLLLYLLLLLLDES